MEWVVIPFIPCGVGGDIKHVPLKKTQLSLEFVFEDELNGEELAAYSIDALPIDINTKLIRAIPQENEICTTECDHFIDGLLQQYTLSQLVNMSTVFANC